MSGPAIYQLTVKAFRGLENFVWRPAKSMNIILGGGDVGKTTILDAIALLLSPTYSTTPSDTDYHARRVEEGFVIEAVMSLPPEIGVNDQTRPMWPWQWNGSEAIVPNETADGAAVGEPVYRLRVRGTPDFDLLYEVVQPDGNVDNLPVALRRAIGLVRLAGDDRNDRDLRLVQGSALDRLLSDKGLRSRLGMKLAGTDVSTVLADEAKESITALDTAFKNKRLPGGLDLGLVGGQGFSVTALIGLTANSEDVQLPLTSWGAGTRRLAALSVAEANQGEAPITLVDEIERGLEPYRQRTLVEALQAGPSQIFVTTHSPAVISAASKASFWFVDHEGAIGRLEAVKIAKQREADPETFLARLAIVTEGATELGFVALVLEKALASSLATQGIHVCDGGGHEKTLELLEALSKSGVKFGGFADDEGKYPVRWQAVANKLGPLLFRWSAGCIEENIIGAVSEDRLEALLIDPSDERTGTRLRTLAVRLGIEQKEFTVIKATAGVNLRDLILAAALGKVPADKESEKALYKSHAQTWFKTQEGGRELAGKMFGLGVWPTLSVQLMQFCNAIRAAVDLPPLQDLAP